MKNKNAGLKAVITVLFGPFGVHKFMERKYKMGFLYLFTFGLCGIGWIVDSFKAISLALRGSHGNRFYTEPVKYDLSQPYDNMDGHTFEHYYAEPVKYDLSQPYDNMDGHTFEHYCAEILSKNGFTDVQITPGSGDQGIDVLAKKDGIFYGIQCKCYSSDIGNKAVQEAYAGKTFYGCHVAVVLTNRHFTKSAKELADSNHVLLWDREELEHLISNCY